MSRLSERDVNKRYLSKYIPEQILFKQILFKLCMPMFANDDDRSVHFIV